MFVVVSFDCSRFRSALQVLSIFLFSVSIVGISRVFFRMRLFFSFFCIFCHFRLPSSRHGLRLRMGTPECRMVWFPSLYFVKSEARRASSEYFSATGCSLLGRLLQFLHLLGFFGLFFCLQRMMFLLLLIGELTRYFVRGAAFALQSSAIFWLRLNAAEEPITPFSFEARRFSFTGQEHRGFSFLQAGRLRLLGMRLLH